MSTQLVISTTQHLLDTLKLDAMLLCFAHQLFSQIFVFGIALLARKFKIAIVEFDCCQLEFFESTAFYLQFVRRHKRKIPAAALLPSIKAWHNDIFFIWLKHQLELHSPEAVRRLRQPR